MGLLNLVWLLGIVFLPFPTAIVGHDASTSSTPLYLGTMLVLAVVTAAMTQLSSRRARRKATAGKWANEPWFGGSRRAFRAVHPDQFRERTWACTGC